MTVTTKPTVRFVPTLTEVVRSSDEPTAPVFDHKALVEQVLQVLKPRLEQQLRTSLYALADEHLCKVGPQLELDIGIAVNAAVAQALTQRIPLRFVEGTSKH